MRVLVLLLALRATSADENDVYASDDNFVSNDLRFCKCKTIHNSDGLDGFVRGAAQGHLQRLCGGGAARHNTPSFIPINKLRLCSDAVEAAGYVPQVRPDQRELRACTGRDYGGGHVHDTARGRVL